MQLIESPGDLNSQVAAEVRAAMARHKVSQPALAAAIGVTQSYLSRRLVGRVPFDIADLGRIAEALETTVSTFLPNGRAA